MNVSFIIFLGTALLFFPGHAQSQEDKVARAMNVVLTLCMSEGFITRIEGSGNVAISATLRDLKNLGAGGNADIKFSKEEWKNVISKMSAASSSINTEQATQTRNCMDAHIPRILQMLN